MQQQESDRNLPSATFIVAETPGEQVVVVVSSSSEAVKTAEIRIPSKSTIVPSHENETRISETTSLQPTHREPTKNKKQPIKKISQKNLKPNHNSPHNDQTNSVQLSGAINPNILSKNISNNNNLQTRDKLQEVTQMMKYFAAASSGYHNSNANGGTGSVGSPLSPTNSPIANFYFNNNNNIEGNASSTLNRSTSQGGLVTIGANSAQQQQSHANNHSTNSNNSSVGLLKNEHTIAWLKKRYLESGNRKYFGDEEDVQQATFIRALFGNIARHLGTPNTIHIADFNRLLSLFELPISYTTLLRLYGLVDANRDNSLNLSEFSDFVLSDATNRVYLDQFKPNSMSSSVKGFANLLYRPTSLSALCIFVSFRIIHDYLTEFLNDPNFQVKDKSQGLAKMLELIKVQGETRIKNEYDKRMIRKLKVENVPSLGFASGLNSGRNNYETSSSKDLLLLEEIEPIHGNQQLNQISDSDDDGSDYQNEFSSSQQQQQQHDLMYRNGYSQKNINNNKNNNNSTLDRKSISTTHRGSGGDGLKSQLELSRIDRDENVNNSRMLVNSLSKDSLLKVKLPLINSANSSVLGGAASSSAVNGGILAKDSSYFSLSQLRKEKSVSMRKSMFEREIDAIIGKANQQGQENAVSQFEQRKDTLKMLRVDALENAYVKSTTKKVFSIQQQKGFQNQQYQDSSAIVAAGNSIMSSSTLRQSPSASFLSPQRMYRQDKFAPGHSSTRNLNADPQENSMTGMSGTMTGRYSKHMGQMMEMALQEADRSRQAFMARRILSVEDSNVMKLAKKKIDLIKKAESTRTAAFTAAAAAASSVKFEASLANPLLSPGLLKQLEGTSFVPKYASFFPSDVVSE